MPSCPNGHHATAGDWCEVCGHRMPATGGMAPPPPPTPAGFPNSGPPPAHAELCPQCRTPREAQAPFCEECRYNFLTHSPTTYFPPAAPAASPAGAPAGERHYGQVPHHDRQHHDPQQQYGQQQGYEPQQYEQQHYGQQQYAQQGAFQQAGAPQSPPSGDWLLPPPSAPPPPASAPVPPPAAPASGRPSGWLLSVGPDREYFTAMMRRSGPEAGQLHLPAYSPEQQIPLSGRQITIGRRRQSTGESPDVDLSRPPEDPGVSHQHALLVQQPDGSWAVVDQDSTNGTTVNGAEEPIQPFVPVPLKEGDRIHVGAWTTLTLRRG
ncbi:FHA domain-containing protein [Streptomyces sp. ACA25]|uniref:FHA domain-containing protein n=1 Tax=Streptomyces sp. ACA25 TaxID=3022596 RepID=UPI0023072156|nr:FHA domain-containing protein [Streptomyces sp. ACA25]MDB1086749.1 FHA domain-containing protein [Streptomyces sp. ACA25]